MKKRLIFILLILSYGFAGCKGQTKTCITYETLYKVSTERESHNKDITVLDINNNTSHFYSKDYERREDVSDSLMQKGYAPAEIDHILRKQGIRHPSVTYNVFKNYPQTGKTTVTQNCLDNFLYEENMPQMNWTLESQDTTIANYTCNKATTTYRGRTWNVYYTLGIPVSDGPWKLCGLPGLILYAQDSRKDFTFQCIGISQGNKRPMVLRKEKYKKCTAKSLCDLIKLSCYSESALIYRLWGIKSTHYDVNGRKMNDPHQTACLIEELK